MSKLHKQVAAAPLRISPNGKLELLLVTSRDTGRWVLPKGWPKRNLTSRRSARLEAFEEAGVTGKLSKKAIGHYQYDKRLENGETLRCEVSVFPMNVQKQYRNWKERKERKRCWFPISKAAALVDEESLKHLLLTVRKGTHYKSLL